MKLRLTSLHRNANGMYENSTKKSKNDKYNGLTAHSLQKPAVVASIQRSQVGTPEAMHVSVTRCRLEDASGLTFKLKMEQTGDTSYGIREVGSGFLDFWFMQNGGILDRDGCIECKTPIF
uniref:PDZ domain-containing protein n=1 Tax=Panagrellus redivivus TaxID=6233 RepID=A0A7E4W147_PANRE